MKTIWAMVRLKLEEHIRGVVSTVIIGLIVLAWTAAYNALNTELTFRLIPANTGLIMLNNPLHDIEEQSRKFCGGGWDTIKGWLALAPCHPIKFDPEEFRNLGVCAVDRSEFRLSSYAAANAIIQLEERYSADRCFHVSDNGHHIRPGPKARRMRIEEGVKGQPGFSSAPQYFCGCSDAAISSFARARGVNVIP